MPSKFYVTVVVNQEDNIVGYGNVFQSENLTNLLDFLNVFQGNFSQILNHNLIKNLPLQGYQKSLSARKIMALCLKEGLSDDQRQAFSFRMLPPFMPASYYKIIKD